MDFIKDLHEARMLRDENNARVLTYTDCIERLYITLLCLEVMRHFTKYTSYVKDYAKKTTRKSATYNTFSMFSSDLYNLIYFVEGNDEALNKLKDPGAAKKLAKTITLPRMRLNRYLTQLAHDARPTDPTEMFAQLERSLKIANTDYKAIRRMAVNLETSNITERKKYITKLVFAVRAKLRNSDIVEKFLEFVTSYDFESSDVPDNEPIVSKPDLDSTTGLAYYRYLVGAQNLMLTQQFLKHSQAGNSVPSQYVQGYMPIIQMIDNIVKAGPTFVNQLKILDQRAKKHLK